LVEAQKFGLIIEFVSVHLGQKWTLVVVYGPCEGEQRDCFVQWLFNIVILDEELWLFMGNFNFIRSQQNRNRPGGNMNDMFIFNEIIDHLGLLELPIKGRSYTWSNMQCDPLLEQLDWFFTSHCWTTVYPNTMVFALAKPTSDHVPCLVSIDTVIPKARLFRFENFWVHQKGFFDCVKEVWGSPFPSGSSAAVLARKLKVLRYELNHWKLSLSGLKLLIDKCNLVILFLDNLEEDRLLSLPERNFRKIVHKHLQKLLKSQHNYWKKRCTIRWMKMGEENTKFFHAMATERYHYKKSSDRQRLKIVR
jgi:mannosylglycoprotein endo-beta-mannosidase